MRIAPQDAEVLLKNGAPVDARDYREHTPLASACFSGSKKCVEMLLSHVYENDFNSQRKMINVTDDEGDTPLHLAAWVDNKEVVKVLMDRGYPDKLAKNNEGHTPLSLAIMKGASAYVSSKIVFRGEYILSHSKLIQ